MALRHGRGVIGTWARTHALAAQQHGGRARSFHSCTTPRHSASAAHVHCHSIEVAGDERCETPVVFIHGLYGSCGNFKSIMKACSTKLGGDRALYSMDLRNHGASDWSDDMSYDAIAEDVRHFILERGDSAIVVGHSLGGRATMAAALKHPGAVAAAMVVDMSPSNFASGVDSAAASVGQAMAALPLAEVVAKKDADALLASALPDPMIRAWVLQNLVKNETSKTSKWKWRHNLKVLMDNLESIGVFELGGPPGVYTGPTLFLHGTRSDYVRPEVHGPLMTALFPHHTVESVDAGHWLHHEKPQEFIDSVVSFTRSADA